jgi:hypothetical protein
MFPIFLFYSFVSDSTRRPHLCWVLYRKIISFTDTAEQIKFESVYYEEQSIFMWVLIVLDKGRITAIHRPLFRKRYLISWLDSR